MNSMTGFGRSQAKIGDGNLTVELRSVNHRYLDLRLRLPGWLSPLEKAVGERIRSRFSRGSIEGTLRFQTATDADTSRRGVKFAIDPVAAESFRNAVEWL